MRSASYKLIEHVIHELQAVRIGLSKEGCGFLAMRLEKVLADDRAEVSDKCADEMPMLTFRDE